MSALPFLPFLCSKKTIERSSFTFTSNGKREFVPRDQVSPLLVVYCSLLLGCLCDPVIKWVFGRRCQKVVPRGREDTRVWYRETMFSQMVSYEFLLHGALRGYFLYLICTHKLEVSRNFLCIRIVLSYFYPLIFYFEKFSPGIWRLPYRKRIKLRFPSPFPCVEDWGREFSWTPNSKEFKV